MGTKTEEEICNLKFVNDTLTFKRSNQSPCKCEGTLSPWSGWSQCSATCGEGTQQRQRRCIGPGDCDGLGHLEEERVCPDLPRCKGTLGQWSEWSQCSRTCGEGTQQRQRRCIGPGDCDGLGHLEEERECPGLSPCKGTLGEWSQWSGCSATCYDEGEEVEGGRPKVEPKRSRTRECLGGPNVTCEDLGELTEVVACVNCKHCFFGGGTAENDEGNYDCDS